MTESGRKDPRRPEDPGLVPTTPEWQLLLDPREARTEPSLRRRVSEASSSTAMDAPTPVEPHSLRYRARKRRTSLLVTIASVAALVALAVGVSVLLRPSAARKAPGAEPSARPTVDAARAARPVTEASEAPSEDESELATEVIDADPTSARPPAPGTATRPGSSPPADSGRGRNVILRRVGSGLAESPSKDTSTPAPRASAASPWFPRD